ncbi:hypothetical protein SPPR111872_08095 [Sphingobacterium prati]
MKQDYFLKISLQINALKVAFISLENNEKRMCC